MNRLYKKLDELRRLCCTEAIEQRLDGITDGKKRLNRLVELPSKVLVTVDEHEELQHLERLFSRVRL